MGGDGRSGGRRVRPDPQSPRRWLSRTVIPGLVPLLSGLDRVDWVRHLDTSELSVHRSSGGSDHRPLAPPILAPAVTPDLFRGPDCQAPLSPGFPRISVRGSPGPRNKSGVTSGAGTEHIFHPVNARPTPTMTGEDKSERIPYKPDAPGRTLHMADTCNYPAEIERDEDGRYVVTFPDFGWGATDGATRNEALAEARDLLRELIATTIRESGNLPKPSRAGDGRPLVVSPMYIAM